MSQNTVVSRGYGTWGAVWWLPTRGYGSSGNPGGGGISGVVSYFKNSNLYLEIDEPSGISIMLGDFKFSYWLTIGRPATPGIMEIGFNTDLGVVEIWNGVSWQTVGGSGVSHGGGNVASNLAVDDTALVANTTGAFNTALGEGALASNLVGDGNTAVGWDALNANTDFFNTAVGSGALKFNTTGTQNVAVGADALQGNTAGIRNVAIGTDALYNFDYTTPTNGGNTAVGDSAGIGITTGVLNTIIGLGDSNVGLGITTGSGNTIIGGGVTGLSPTLTNNIILADGVGNQRLNIDSAGLVTVLVQAATNGFRASESANEKQGVATLVAGTKVVSNTSITANSRIFLTAQETGLFTGSLRVSARSVGTSFTILSTVLTDTAVVAYEIFEPA